jgi:hypothetical protein
MHDFIIKYSSIKRNRINEIFIQEYLTELNFNLESSHANDYEPDGPEATSIYIFICICKNVEKKIILSFYKKLNFLDRVSIFSNLKMTLRDIYAGKYRKYSYFARNENQIVNGINFFIQSDFYNVNLLNETEARLANSILYDENKELAFFVDDITIEARNTLSKLIFDIIKLLQNDFLKFYIIPYRAHGFKDQVRFPQNHYWNHIDVSEFKESMDLPTDLYEKIKIINLEDILEGRLLKINCAFLFPFRFPFLDKIIGGLIPSIGYEMMVSGQIDKNGATVIIPNGLPSAERYVVDSIATIYAVPPVFFGKNDFKNLRKVPVKNRSIISIASNMKERCGENFYKFESFINSYLDKFIDARVYLIGYNDKLFKNQSLNAYINQNRLIIKPYSTDLNLECVDYAIYVHPPISGGGRSTYIAATNNLWVLSLFSTDAVRWTHPEFRFQETESYYNTILSCSEDLDLIFKNAIKSNSYVSMLLKNTISLIDYRYVVSKATELYKLSVSNMK